MCSRQALLGNHYMTVDPTLMALVHETTSPFVAYRDVLTIRIHAHKRITHELRHVTTKKDLTLIQMQGLRNFSIIEKTIVNYKRDLDSVDLDAVAERAVSGCGLPRSQVSGLVEMLAGKEISMYERYDETWGRREGGSGARKSFHRRFQYHAKVLN